MRAVQVNLRRWCRNCGLPSPAGQPRCVHCEADPQTAVRPRLGVRDVLTTHNVGENVQNNVINIENMFGGDDDDVYEPELEPEERTNWFSVISSFILGFAGAIAVFAILLCGFFWACVMLLK